MGDRSRAFYTVRSSCLSIKYGIFFSNFAGGTKSYMTPTSSIAILSLKIYSFTRVPIKSQILE